MADAIGTTSDQLGFFPWFRSFLKEELAPYPGRGVMVARMVIAATVTMILIMTFRIPGGFEGALYAFMIARDDLRSTLKSGIAIAVSYTLGVAFVLTCAALFASNPSARFLWFAVSMFVVFFALDTFQDFAVATGFAVIMVLALPIWQTHNTAENRVELTLWQALACVLGTVITILVEAVFRSVYPKNELLQGLDDRLSTVQGLIEEYAECQPISEDVANRLAKYTIVGVSGLRRILARSRYKHLYQDQMSAVVALTGRLVDLGASSARSPHELLDGDRDRLRGLATQIEIVRKSLVESEIPPIPPDMTIAHSGIPLVPEMERTVSLIPRVFSGSTSVDAYFPSMLDLEEKTGGFFKSDAFQNPAHIYFALRGCLAATLCYFTYEILDWRGLATSVTTCALTALSNVGTSRQKQLLRITGAIAGGLILGIGSQLFILPYIDTITEFSLLFAAITAVAAWCATSSQRLSYFGLQIANAYYLVTVSGFSFEPSLATARDRVVGVMLGLFVMWLAYHSYDRASAAEHMVEFFSDNLRAVGELALQPGTDLPDRAMKRIRTLRSQIGNNFQNVTTQSDAVPLEFGAKRAENMANRALIRSWLPQLQTIYLMEVALMQHRVFGADAHLPPDIQAAQFRFNQACASLLRQMADHIDGMDADITSQLDASLAQLSRALEETSSDHSGFVAALGQERLSKCIRDELMGLSQGIGQSSLSRNFA
jgi:multidrug resistance protein MdtO